MRGSENISTGRCGKGGEGAVPRLTEEVPPRTARRNGGGISRHLPSFRAICRDAPWHVSTGCVPPLRQPLQNIDLFSLHPYPVIPGGQHFAFHLSQQRLVGGELDEGGARDLHLRQVDVLAGKEVLDVRDHFQRTDLADGDEVEEAVVRVGHRHLAHPVAVVLRVAARDGEQIVAVAARFRGDGHAGGFVAEEDFHQLEEIDRVREQFRLAMDGLVDDRRVEGEAGDVDEPAAVRHRAILDGFHDAHVRWSELTVFQEVDEPFRFRVAERAAEVVSGAERDDGEVDLLRVHPRAVNAVDDFVDAAVAAHHHQVVLSFTAEPFGSLSAPFAAVRNVQDVADVVIFQLFEDVLLDDGAVSVQQGRVGDDVPVVGGDVHDSVFLV